MKPLHYICLIGVATWLTCEMTHAQRLEKLAQQKPFEIHGSLTANVQFYSSTGIANRLQPFTWFLTGSPVIKIYNMTFPFTLVVSEQERRFSQPFNQYGVSPYYKSLKLHLGYRNVRFSDYTLGGANFLGAGFEFTPKVFRLGFVYGQFARAINEDESLQDSRYQYIRPVYQRLGWAAKVGVGSSKAFLDFSIFKAKDVIGSINRPSERSLVLPMENLAIGLKNHLGFFKQKLTFDVDLGASLLTRNSLKKDLESPKPWQNILLNIVAVNPTSNFFTAASAAIGYGFKGVGLKLVYQRIDPDYRSLGAYFFQNDVEQLTINPSFTLFKNKVSVSGSYGRSHDNLHGNKGATTHRNVGSIALSIVPSSKWNVRLNYSNFGVGQSRGIGDFFNDSLAISVVNSSYGGSVSYNLSNRVSRQNIGFLATYQSTNDQNEFTRQYSGASSLVASLNYGYFFLLQKLNSTLSLSYVAIETGGRKLVTFGPAFTLSKELIKLRLRASVNHNSQFRTTNSQADGFMANTGLNVSHLYKKQSVSLGVNYLYNQYGIQQNATTYRNFSEIRSTLSYGIRF